MGKLVHDNVLDGALNILKNGGTQLCVCSTQPTTYTEATVTYMLAIKSDLTSGSYTGPGDGDTNGRKLTVNQQATIEVINTGNAQHIAICDVDDRLLYVTTCTAQVLTDGNTVTIPAWDIEIADPT
jgi:hypothetical protein